jgi:integrase
MIGARKSEVDLVNMWWLIPGDREGNKGRNDHLVPLPPLAAQILQDAIKASGKSPFVFPSAPDAETPILRNVPSQGFRKLCDKLGVGATTRFHDARGLINDRMSFLRVPREYRSHVLNHTSDIKATLADATYSTYDFADEKRRALLLWEQRLLEIVEGRPASGLKW